MTRVIVAAASDVTRAGLLALTARLPDIEIVGSASDAATLGVMVRTQSPDVVLIELEPHARDGALLAGGLDGGRGPAVVILGDEPVEVDAGDPSHSGSGRAVLPRKASAQEIEAAIKAAGAGLIVAHPDFVYAAGRLASPAVSADGSVLTPREIEVLRMLAAGLPNKSIATRLGVSSHTVKFHVGSIMAKLHAGSRTEAVTEGIRRGLIFV
jgi:DNA-binding NarL/FixJ family response regulator